MPGSFTREEAFAYLNSKPGMMVITTIGKNGFPHSVPLGFFVVGEEIYIGGRESTQRVKNVERNPKVCLEVDTGRGEGMGALKGVVVQGEADVVREPARVLELLRQASRMRGVAEAELPKEPRPGVAYIRVKPKKIISWDYSRT